MDKEKQIKISNWMGEAISPDSKISPIDQFRVGIAVMKAIEEIEPIYDKYNAPKKRKSKKDTANLLGDEFAREVFKGMMKFSDL